MNTLAPKLVLTPLLVASTSLAGRRWGPSLSGWLVALPLTSGPIVFFIAVEAGPDVAQQAAGGALIGATAQVAFAAAYTLMARRRLSPGRHKDRSMPRPARNFLKASPNSRYPAPFQQWLAERA